MPLIGLRSAPSKKTILWLLSTVLLVAACAAAPDTGEVTGGGLSDPNPPGFFPTDPVTEQGGYIAGLYPLVFFIAVAVFVLVEGLLLLIVLRFRRRPLDGALPAQTHGNNLLEIIWTAIPALVVTGLFVLTMGTLVQVEARAESPAVEIDVTGFQFQWTFEYRDRDISLTGAGREGPVMAIPINETVRIRLHGQDVIHSFYVPQFLYKKDVVPGRVNEFDVIVREPGTYTGQCAEFCGFGHADMFFTVQAMERADYDAWLAEQTAAEPAASPPADAVTLTLESVDINTFNPSSLEAPADTAIVFELHNVDPAAPHNVAIAAALEDGTDWVGMPIAQAGQNATYTAPALPAGTYEFYCSVHPETMRGTLTVGSQ